MFPAALTTHRGALRVVEKPRPYTSVATISIAGSERPATQPVPDAMGPGFFPEFTHFRDNSGRNHVSMIDEVLRTAESVIVHP